MAKTQVILTSNLVGLGAESDHVKVSPGYARNYLFPEGLAIPLTSANKKQLESLRRRRAEREAHDLNTMSELASSLSKIVVKLTVKTGDDGKMFGSITGGTIADELKNQCEVTLDKRKIHLEHPIRTLGDHEVELRLHPHVVTHLKLHVESSTPLPAPAAPAAPADGKAGRGEGRFGRSPRFEGKPGKPEAAPAPAPVAEARKDKPAGKPAGKPAADKKSAGAKKEAKA